MTSPAIRKPYNTRQHEEDLVLGAIAQKRSELLAAVSTRSIDSAPDPAIVNQIGRLNAQAQAIELRATRTFDSPPAPINSPASASTRAERERVTAIHRIGAQHGIAADAIERAVESGQSLDGFRNHVLDTLADRSLTGAGTGVRTHVSRDETDTRREGIAAAIAARMARAAGENPVLPDIARRFGEMSIAEAAAEAIGYRGPLRTSAHVQHVLERAMHTTSDFPAILQDAMGRRLLTRYQNAAPTYRRFSARYSVSDFRAMNVIRAGDFPALQEVNESGEIKSGTFSESKETVAAKSYGVMLSFTRQMLINDQLNAIDQVLSSAGARASDWENSLAFALLAQGSGAGPVLLTDNKRVFHGDHGNLAGSGGAINVTTVGAGRAAMMKQKTLDGMIANFQPAILLTGPDKMTEAEQLLTSITPAASANAVPESLRRLTPVGDANIAGNAWYLFADPTIAPTFVYALLDGFEGPRLTSENTFGVQGMRVKLEHDFGVSAIDFRGGYRNPGA